MGEVVCERRVRCLSPLAALWEVVADTDALNWAAGMERVSAQPISVSGAARFRISTRLGGFAVTFDEEPYQWVYHQSLRVRRHVHHGPVKRIDMGITLAPEASGATLVTLMAHLLPRHAAWAPVVWWRGRAGVAALAREVARLDQAMVRGERAPPARPAAPLDEATFAAAWAAAVAAHPSPLWPRLEQLLRHGSDLQVERVRPFALADGWGAARAEVLSLCIEAAVAGLLELRWEVICPSCRTATASVPGFAELAEHISCPLCDIRFAVRAQDTLELAFRVAARLRRSDHGPYCIGGPARSPHVLAQAILPAGGQASLPAPREAGKFQLFVRGGAYASLQVVPHGGQERLELACDRLNHLEPLQVAPGAELTVTSALPYALHVKVERSDWAGQAATLRDVLDVPAYRAHFPVPKFA